MALIARKTTSFAWLTTLLVLGALSSPEATTAAFAGSNEPAPSLSEFRERERFAEEQRQIALRRLEVGISSGSIDPDEASDTRFRIEQSYKRDINLINDGRDQLVQGLEARDQADRNRSAHRKAASTNAPSSAIPRFQPQSVITYPQAGSSNLESAPPIEKPYREGRQTNGDFGKRELEF